MQDRLEESERLVASMSRSWEDREREGRELEEQRRQLRLEWGLSVSDEDLSLPQVQSNY